MGSIYRYCGIKDTQRRTFKKLGEKLDKAIVNRENPHLHVLLSLDVYS
jgi:hypothetical protein